jgi:DNA-binding response OmpR family regulator
MGTDTSEEEMPKILVAEDEPDIRELIVFSLKFAGFDVVTAVDGEQAVQMALQEKPDLVMLDVRMPKMTGYEACAAIKKSDELKEVPVIMLSAKGQHAEIEAGLEAGAYEYILKPFVLDELVNKVRAAVGESGMDVQECGDGTSPEVDLGPVSNETD